MSVPERALASRRHIAPWPLGWVERLPRPVLTSGLLAGAVVGLGLWGTGAFDAQVLHGYWSTREQIISMAIAYTALVAYLHAAFVYAAQRSEGFANDLQPLIVDEAGRELARTLNRVSRPSIAFAAFVGVILGVANVDLPTLVGRSEHAATRTDWGLAAANLVIWTSVARLGWVRIHNAFTLSRLGRRHVRVDLYEPAPLRVFARSGILDLLIVVGALALTPLQALDAEFRVVNYTSAFLIGVPSGLILLFAPMWGVRQRLSSERARALREVQAAIARAEPDLADPALLHLNALLERRNHLMSLSTWPIDARSLSKAALSLVIPPLAWVAAALVERGVESWLGQ